MIAIPFVYFSLLAYFIYLRNKRFDLAVFICLCYAITGFFSILMDSLHMRIWETRNYQISLLAAIVYCFSITLCILPVARFSKHYMYGLTPLPSDKFLKIIARILSVFFLVFILLTFNDIVNALTGDMRTARSDIYKGLATESWMSRIRNPIIRAPLALFNLLTGAPWVFVMLAFYCSTVQKMQFKYVVMFFVVSLMGPLSGIMGADRSVTTYWIISVVACYIMFRPYMSEKQGKVWLFFGVGFVMLALWYISLMTTARFADRYNVDGYTGGQLSIVSYLGQNYVNFCYFFDEFTSPVFFPGILFPFITSVFGGLSGGVPLQQYVELLTGVRTGVFYTFLGHIKIFAGPVAMVLYVLFVSVGGSAFLRRVSLRPSIYSNFVYMLVASVSLLGLFGNYYSSGPRTFCVVAFLIILSRLSKK